MNSFSIIKKLNAIRKGISLFLFISFLFQNVLFASNQFVICNSRYQQIMKKEMKDNQLHFNFLSANHANVGFNNFKEMEVDETNFFDKKINTLAENTSASVFHEIKTKGISKKESNIFSTDKAILKSNKNTFEFKTNPKNNKVLDSASLQKIINDDLVIKRKIEPKKGLLKPKVEIFDTTQASSNTDKATPIIAKNEDSKNEFQQEIYNSTGPHTPEFSSFESVTTTNMVDPYTGDLTYSLPVLEVPGAHDGGYSVALAYQSGAGANDDASWVGHGWNLSPGAINRIKKGFPDDINGGVVNYINQTPANQTIKIAPALGMEAFSFNANIAKFFRYNNYKGYGGGFATTFSAFSGVVGASWVMENGKGSFSPFFNPVRLLSFKKDQMKWRENDKRQPLNGKQALMYSLRKTGMALGSQISSGYNAYGVSLFSDFGGPSNPTEYDGSSSTADFGAVFDIPTVTLGFTLQASATYTIQTPKRQKGRYVFGYLYSDKTFQSSSTSDSYTNDMMDYHLEKDMGEFKRRDQYLPIPFVDVDVYNVSAEGLSGSFRAFWNKPTMMFPPSSANNMNIGSFHAQAHIGTTIGLGTSVDWGEHSSKSSYNWADNENTDQFKAHIKAINTSPPIKEDEPFYFKFFGDQGGSTLLDDNFTKLPISYTSNVPSLTFPPPLQNLEIPFPSLSVGGIPLFGGSNEPSVKPSIGTGNAADYLQRKNLTNFGRVGRTSYISYHTNKQIVTNLNTVIKQNFEYKYAIGNSFINRNEPSIIDHIGEFSIVKPGGELFVYGLPVYNRYEQSYGFTIDANSIILPYGQTNPYTHQVNANILGKSKVGESHLYSYPAYYLLTSIRSADYSDINDNGVPDYNDLGGYTTFDYRKAHGTLNKSDNSSPWFSWRTPYSGLNLDLNHLDNPNDNSATYSKGEKEIYYTRAIETKTHIAVFVTNKCNLGYSPFSSVILPNTTGSGIVRKDGMSANTNEVSAAKGELGDAGICRPEFLEKILLFSKPIGGTSSNVDDYKLLKTVNFKYSYKIWPSSPDVEQTIGSSTINGKLTLEQIWVDHENVKKAQISPYKFEYVYPSVTNTYPSKYSNLANYYNGKLENPNYRTEHAECSDRWGNYMYAGFQNRNEMRPYTPQKPDASFDPSAWQLKKVVVPTGSEIHVQYEEDDYLSVQDKKACIMIPLFTAPQNGNGFVVDMSDFLNTSDIPQYVADLQQHFGSDNPYIYFKFLYNLRGSDLPTLPMNNCTSDYVSGYVKFHSVQQLAGTSKIMFFIGDGNNPSWNQVMNFPVGSYQYPKSVCLDYIISETGLQYGVCNPSINFSTPSPIALGLQLLGSISQHFSDFGNSEPTCKIVNPALSYFKLPIFDKKMAKKGGGLRVKRLLRFDKGMRLDGADKTLYGVEYTYHGKNQVSSGVASNEPPEGKDESAITEYVLKRSPQNGLNKALSGADLFQFEGPYGETALPAAGVGYSSVSINNIHNGAKTDDGVHVYEFHTAADFPFDAIFAGDDKFFDHSYMTKLNYANIDLGILKTKMESNMYAMQSYHHIIYNMSGKPKSEYKYLGNKPDMPVYAKKYEYFKPGERIKVLNEVISKIPNDEYLGVDMDIVVERKRSIEHYQNEDANLDLAWGGLWPSGGVSYWKNIKNTEISTLVTNKTTFLPVILKSVSETKGGISHTSENIAFSKFSGNPVIVRSDDEFKGSGSVSNNPSEYYSYTQPATFNYPNFNQVAINQDKVENNGGTISILGSIALMNLNFSNVSPTVGDLLELFNTTNNSIKFLYVSKVLSTVQFEVEKYNTSLSALNFHHYKVLKSGRKNSMDEPQGNIVTYGEMPAITSSIMRLNDNNFTSVSGVALNMGEFGISGNLGVIANSPSNSCLGVTAEKCVNHRPNTNADMIYESFIDVANNLYIVKYDVDNCVFMCPNGSESIAGTPLALNPNYTSVLPLNAANYPHFIHGFELLGKAGGFFSLAESVCQPNSIYGSGYSLIYHPPVGPLYSLSEKICKCNFLIPNVVSVSASTFSNNWDHSLLKDYQGINSVPQNSFKNNRFNMWERKLTYAYKENRGIDFNSGAILPFSYNSGLFTMTYNNWSDFSDPKWIKASEAVSYSPHADLIEEKDALGIISSSHYTIGKSFPSFTMQNASHNAGFYEGFEDYKTLSDLTTLYGGNYTFDLNSQTNINYTPSGKNLIGFPSGTGGSIVIPFKTTPDYYSNSATNLNNFDNEVVVRFWASCCPNFEENPTWYAANTAGTPNVKVELLNASSSILFSVPNATKVFSVGVYTLYEAKLKYNGIAQGTNAKIRISSTVALVMDDIRYQPKNSVMSITVYDASKKQLLAGFDDAHVPIKYIYSPEGKLVRKLRWTEKGVKVTEEMFQNNGLKEPISISN
jgi:hypothetical protein